MLYMHEIDLFTARNMLHSRIKTIPGFRGINVNSKVGVGGILCIYVTDQQAKENLYKICGDMQHGYYIEYIKTEGLKFS